MRRVSYLVGLCLIDGVVIWLSLMTTTMAALMMMMMLMLMLAVLSTGLVHGRLTSCRYRVRVHDAAVDARLNDLRTAKKTNE